MTHTYLKAAVLLFAAALANAQSPADDNVARQQPQQVNVPGAPSTPVDDKTQQQATSSDEPAVPAATETAREKQVDRKPAGTVEARFDARYTQLRRGRDQEIAILLCPPENSYCWLENASLKNQPIPVSLRMEAMEGFTIRYGYPRHYEPAPQGTPKYPADRRLMFIKVHADSTLGTGSYFLKGTVIFHMVGDDASAEQTTDIHIPVTVVDHDATVSQNDWRYIHHPGRVAGDVASNVAWAVLLVPLLPVLGLGCLITVHSLDCH